MKLFNIEIYCTHQSAVVDVSKFIQLSYAIYKPYILVNQFDALTLSFPTGHPGEQEPDKEGKCLLILRIIIAIMTYNSNDKPSDVRYYI